MKYIKRNDYLKSHRFINNKKVYSFYDKKENCVVMVDRKKNKVFAKQYIPDKIYLNPKDNPNLKAWKE